MCRLWDHTKVCQDAFRLNLSMKFKHFDCEEKEDQIKKLRNGLLPIKVSDRKCSAFMGITDEIKKWAVFIPLLTDLKDPSMEVEDDRHWAKIR